MRILITGAHGTVGSALSAHVRALGGMAIPWDRQQARPGDENATLRLLDETKPTAIIHTAMPSQSTGIENEGWVVNEKWTADIARAAGQRGIPFIYTSTVMVFSSKAVGPFTPDATPDETEGYGYGKRLGELAALEANPDTRIARLGWQIGTQPGSNNMIDYFHRQMAEHCVIHASTSWLPATSFLPDTAAALVELTKMEPGIYHLGSNDRWNFYQIAWCLNKIHGSHWVVRANDDFVYDQRMIDDRVYMPKLEQHLPELLRL